MGGPPGGPRGFLRAYSDSTPQAGSICHLESPGYNFKCGVFLAQSKQKCHPCENRHKGHMFLLRAKNKPILKLEPGESR